MYEQLLSKQGLAIIRVAEALGALAVGNRLDPVQDQATRYNLSVGTIQAALDYLQSTGLVQIEARGRLGSYAAKLDYPRLWEIAQRRPIVGTLPLPYARHIEGLATAFRQQFADQNLDLSLRFTRGSAQRMQALSAGESDWAIVSRFAAETAASHGFVIDIYALLGEQSYMDGHSLVTRTTATTPYDTPGLLTGMRVGIDTRSTDHAYSVRSIVRGMAVTLVPIEYHQGVQLVRDGVIDATIWSNDQRGIPTDLRVTPFAPEQEAALSALREAAIVTRSGNLAVAHILHALLEVSGLRHIQHTVIGGQRLPEY